MQQRPIKASGLIIKPFISGAGLVVVPPSHPRPLAFPHSALNCAGVPVRLIRHNNVLIMEEK